MAPMISGTVRRYLRPRSGRMAAGCASVNGMRAPSARLLRARSHADAEVRADPVRSRAECQIDVTAGTQPRRIDLQHVQAERVCSGVLLAHFLPAVEPPAHRARLTQGDRERTAFGQLRRRSLLAPDDAGQGRALAAVTLPYGVGTVERSPQRPRRDQLEILGVRPQDRQSTRPNF